MAICLRIEVCGRQRGNDLVAFLQPYEPAARQENSRRSLPPASDRIIGRPREKGIDLDRGLAFSRGSRGCWGNAANDYKAKGAQKVDDSAPLLPLPRTPGSAIATMKLRLAKGGKPTFCSLECGYVCVLLSGGSNGQC
jgi:hypothetical protein